MYFVSFLYKIVTYEDGVIPVLHLGKCWFDCSPENDEDMKADVIDILFEGLVLCKPDMQIDFDPSKIKKADISVEIMSSDEGEIHKNEKKFYRFFYVENQYAKKKFYYNGNLLMKR